jgi:fructose-bisphosphate aldolase class II
MIVPAAALYRLAYSQYALGGYNINNLEQILGLFKGCIDSQAPFILQISKGARSYADKRMLEAIIRTAKEIYPEAVFARAREGRRRGIVGCGAARRMIKLRGFR